MIANTAIYRDGRRLQVDVKPDDLDAIRKAVKAGQPGDFVSIGLHEPGKDEMDRVAKIFGLHRLAVEDSLNPVQRPKLERYGDMVFLVLKTLWFDKEADAIKGGQVAIFMGADFAITVRQGAQFKLESVRKALEQHTDVLRQGPAAVVYAVSDHVVDVYEDVVSALGDDVDDLEDTVFAPAQTNDASKQIYRLNRELITLRRAVTPLTAPMQQFADAKVPGVSKDAALFFRDVADHLARVGDAVDSLDNMLSSASDVNLSRIGVQQNDDMRQMSAWAAIAAVITVLAGIYGMNFTNMPELGWSFGYPLLLLVMVVVSVVLHRKFKKSGWL